MDINSTITLIESAKTQADYTAAHADLKAWLAAGHPNLGATVSMNGSVLCMWLEQIKLHGLTDERAKNVAGQLPLFRRAVAGS